MLTVWEEEFMRKQIAVRHNLVQFMLNNNMTWKELGEKTGVSYVTLLKFSQKQKDISRQTMFKIEQYLMSAEKV